MHDHLIRIAVIKEIWTTVAAERLSEACRRGTDEEGQTAAEYLGIILVVGVIIAVVSTSDIGKTLGRELNDLVESIAGGENPKGTNKGDS